MWPALKTKPSPDFLRACCAFFRRIFIGPLLGLWGAGRGLGKLRLRLTRPGVRLAALRRALPRLQLLHPPVYCAEDLVRILRVGLRSIRRICCSQVISLSLSLSLSLSKHTHTHTHTHTRAHAHRKAARMTDSP